MWDDLRLRSRFAPTGDEMRLPVFIVGLFLSVALAAAIGYAAGFGPLKLILFCVAVAVVLQLAYVLVVALLAAERSRKTRPSRPAEAADPTAPHATGKTDA